MTAHAATPDAPALEEPPPEVPPADAPSPDFDALILAVGPAARRHKVCGLTLAERGRRTAQRAGASRVIVVDDAEAARRLAAELSGTRDLVVLQCADQVVHFPLLDAVRGGGARIAIGEDGAYAGCLWIPAAQVPAALAAIAANPETGDAELAAAWRAGGEATTHVHGPIARHRAVTRDERRAATKMLFQIIYKPQDAALSKILFRPIAYPITRLLLPTFVTPNMVTFMAAAMALTGCVIVAGASYEAAVVGALLQHLASYLDCTDGEIARLRHEGSKMGQWYDTLADEATTIAYTAGIGYHVYRNHEGAWYHPYLGWSIPIAVAGTLVSVYVIYYYLIKVSRTGNSQDYPVKQGQLTWLSELTHRDFIGLATFVLAVVNLNEIAYAMLAVGAVVSAVILFREHVQLREDLRAGRVVPRPG